MTFTGSPKCPSFRRSIPILIEKLNVGVAWWQTKLGKLFKSAKVKVQSIAWWRTKMGSCFQRVNRKFWCRWCEISRAGNLSILKPPAHLIAWSWRKYWVCFNNTYATNVHKNNIWVIVEIETRAEFELRFVPQFDFWSNQVLQCITGTEQLLKFWRLTKGFPF